jgi:hypothetical protein
MTQMEEASAAGIARLEDAILLLSAQATEEPTRNKLELAAPTG